MQPGQAVLRKRCIYVKKNMTALEMITWLDSNKKYHSHIARKFIQFNILPYTVALSNFGGEGFDFSHCQQT